MAFIAQEEEDDQQGTQSTAGSQGSAISGGGGSPTAPAPAAESASGQFTNIKQYLDANKPKAEQLSSAVAGGIEKDASAVREDTAQKRQEAMDPMQQEQQRLAGGEQFIQEQINQAGQQPVSESASDRFQRLRGPQQAQQAAPELQQQRASASDLERRSKALGTSAGREEELSRTVGQNSPQYSAGQRSLDKLLMARSTPSRLDSIKRAQDATKGLSSQVQAVGTDAATMSQQQAAERSRLQQLAQSGVSGAREQLRGDLDARLASRQASGSADLQAFKDQQAAGAGVDSELLKRMGLEGGIGETYGVDASQILRDPTVTRAGVTTQEDLARLNALAGLAGQQGNQYGLTSEQLGATSGFGANDLQAAIAAQKGKYESDIAGVSSDQFSQGIADSRSRMENQGLYDATYSQYALRNAMDAVDTPLNEQEYNQRRDSNLASLGRLDSGFKDEAGARAALDELSGVTAGGYDRVGSDDYVKTMLQDYVKQFDTVNNRYGLGQGIRTVDQARGDKSINPNAVPIDDTITKG